MTPSKSSNRLPKGFTLIETLIALALTATALLTLFLVYVAALDSRAIASSQARLLDARRVFEETLRAQVEAADDIVTPASGSATTLVLAFPDADPSSVTLTVSDGRFFLQEGSGPAVALTPTNVEIFGFSAERLTGNPPSVALTYTLAVDATPRVRIEETYAATYVLNYE